MEHYLNGFLRYIVIEKNTSSSTYEKYQSDCTKLIGYLEKEYGIDHPGNIKIAHLRDYFGLITEKSNLKPTSVGSKIAVIKSFFNYLADSEVIDI